MKRTIVDAAQKVLKDFGRPASIDEIYNAIVDCNLYKFNSPTPQHVLRTIIRRQTEGVDRVDSSERTLFRIVGDENYYLIISENTSEIDEYKLSSRRAKGTTSMRRILRASDKEDIVKALMSDQVAVFKEIWKLLLFAAQVGIKNRRRERLSATDPGKGIDQATFGNCSAWPGLLYLMSLIETESSESLSGSQDADDLRISIFQEYANGGLEALQEFFSGRSIDLDGVLAFIETELSERSGILDLEFTI